MIDRLISMVKEQLGLDENSARGGVGVALALIKKFGEDGAASELLGKIPGADALASAEEGRVEAGGGLGGLVGNLLGGDAGDAAKALGAMKDLGIDLDDGKKLVSLVGSFLKEHAGEELLNRVLGDAGWLKDLL